jgi:GTP pyrophosphokinase
MAAQDIRAEVSGRPKHIYSIWNKMRGKSIDFSELYDVRAFRVIVDDVKTCYAVLGIVHDIWTPIPRSSTTTSRAPSRTATSPCTRW